MSRLTLNEAAVNVQGLKSEVLIGSLQDQNRALCGDIVAIEVLHKSKWIKNYKTADCADVLDDIEAEGLLEVDNAEAK